MESDVSGDGWAELQRNTLPESGERGSHLRGNSTGPNYYDSTLTETERRGIGKNVYLHCSMASSSFRCRVLRDRS